MYEPRDEISLRELYLIFRSGFIAIVLAALVAGAAAFLYVGSQAETFEASATSQIVVPAPSAASEEAAWLITPPGITWNSYSALARRPEVIAEALGVPPSNTEAIRNASGSLTLEDLGGSSQVRGELTALHTASAATPQEAAAVANRWATATVQAATGLMVEGVNSNAEAALGEIEQREADLKSARESLTSFAEHDDRAVLTSLLNVQQQIQRDSLLRLAQLENLQATARAKRDMLQAVLESRSGGSSQPLGAQLDALVASGALDSQTAAQLEASLSQLPAGAASSGQDLMLLVTRTQLETLTSDLAGYVAEHATLTQRLSEAEAEQIRLRTELAEVEQAAGELEAQLALAQASYDNVIGLAPLIRLQQSSISNAGKVTVAAVPPIEPQPRNRLTITLAAAVVAGLLATLIVFLRAAIREPSAPVEKLGINARQYEIDHNSGNVRRTGEWPAVDVGSAGGAGGADGAGQGSGTEGSR